MKNRTIATILVSVILLSTVFSLITSADSTDIRPRMIFDHFDRLDGTTNCPPNMGNTMIDGTCAFVAMSMLLAYYDTYWNDNIVPETLDWQEGEYNSTTDRLTSTFNANEEAEQWDPDAFNKNAYVQDNKDKFLQCYLIDVCNNLPIIDEFGVFAYQTQDILEYYLYDDKSFSEDEITVHLYRANNETEKETMINMAKGLIEDGYPIIFSGFDHTIEDDEAGDGTLDIGGHTMIGYDFTTLDDGKYDITVNLCWNNGEKQNIRSSDYSWFNSIIWLEINEENLPHVCSNNYVDKKAVNNDDDEYFCSCDIYYNTHPEHKYHHNYQFNGYDSESHYINCICGNKINGEIHDLRYSRYGTSMHTKWCADCDYGQKEVHNYNIFDTVSANGHTMKCICGTVSSSVEAHYTSRYVSLDEHLHYVYCKCGYLMGTDLHHMNRWGLNDYSRCMDCGYVRDNSGNSNIIMGTEDDSESFTE